MQMTAITCCCESHCRHVLLCAALSMWKTGSCRADRADEGHIHLCHAGFRDGALRDGEALPDVIELEAADVVDRLQMGDNAAPAAAKGVSSTGRDSIGKTSLQAAAKVGAYTRVSFMRAHS